MPAVLIENLQAHGAVAEFTSRIWKSHHSSQCVHNKNIILFNFNSTMQQGCGMWSQRYERTHNGRQILMDFPFVFVSPARCFSKWIETIYYNEGNAV